MSPRPGQSAADSPTPHGASVPGRVPSPVRAAVAVVGVEAVLLVGAAVWGAVDLVRGAAASAGLTAFLVLCELGVAAGLLAAGRALLRGRRGGRAPVVTWQLLQAATCVALLQVVSSGVVAVAAWVALAAAFAVVVLLLTPAAVAATTGRPGGTGS